MVVLAPYSQVGVGKVLVMVYGYGVRALNSLGVCTLIKFSTNCLHCPRIYSHRMTIIHSLSVGKPPQSTHVLGGFFLVIYLCCWFTLLVGYPV